MTSRNATKQEDTHFRVLRLLQENPSLTQRELADTGDAWKLAYNGTGGMRFDLDEIIGRFAGPPDQSRKEARKYNI